MSTNKSKNAPQKPAELFILESLSLDDEAAQRHEGRILADILRLCEQKPRYFYFRTRKELEHFAVTFKESKYRYLHLSCHGDAHQLLFTHDAVSFTEFGEIFRDVLKNGRLFVSACHVGSKHLVDAVSQTNCGMYSIMAPAQAIPFADAMAFWAGFYVRLMSGSLNAKNDEIVRTIRSLRQIFPTPILWAFHETISKQWKTSRI